jgi:hypothetical protein
MKTISLRASWNKITKLSEQDEMIERKREEYRLSKSSK